MNDLDKDNVLNTFKAVEGSITGLTYGTIVQRLRLNVSGRRGVHEVEGSTELQRNSS